MSNEKNHTERFIEKDPFLTAVSDWMKDWDYDGWKEAVLWPEDDSTDFLARAESLRELLAHHGVVLVITEE